jgi:hypothetical protein
MIQAKGGKDGEEGCGEGSGGRIKLECMDYYFKSENNLIDCIYTSLNPNAV